MALPNPTLFHARPGCIPRPCRTWSSALLKIWGKTRGQKGIIPTSRLSRGACSPRFSANPPPTSYLLWCCVAVVSQSRIRSRAALGMMSCCLSACQPNNGERLLLAVDYSGYRCGRKFSPSKPSSGSALICMGGCTCMQPERIQYSVLYTERGNDDHGQVQYYG